MLHRCCSRQGPVWNLRSLTMGKDAPLMWLSIAENQSMLTCQEEEESDLESPWDVKLVGESIVPESNRCPSSCWWGADFRFESPGDWECLGYSYVAVHFWKSPWFLCLSHFKQTRNRRRPEPAVLRPCRLGRMLISVSFTRARHFSAKVSLQKTQKTGIWSKCSSIFTPVLSCTIPS